MFMPFIFAFVIKKILKRPFVYSKLHEKIRKKLSGVNHFRFRILQVTNNLINKGKTI